MLLLVLTAGTAAAQSLPPSAEPSDDRTTIYVARRSWHVDVGFAAADVEPPLQLGLQALPGAAYVFFGFGNRGYLTSSHRHAPNSLAALWPGEGLILATGLRASPADGFGADQVIELRVSRAASRGAQEFIRRSLRDEATVIPGPYEGSVYFSARPRYSAVHTCNTWAAEALASAGLPVRSRGVLFASQLWGRVRQLAAAEPAATE
jgi:hypothetical protein